MLRCIVAGEADGLIDGACDDEAAAVLQGGAGNVAAGQDGQTLFDLSDNLLGEVV